MNDSPTYDEQVLLQRIAEGDEPAFTIFFHRYGPSIHAFIMKLVKQDDTGRDLLQEVFIKAWINRSALPAIHQPSSWLYRVASNLCINHLRRKQIELNWLRELTPAEGAADSRTDSRLIYHEALQLIRNAVQLLPPQRQRIYQLSREQGFDRKEIGSLLNISENTVKNQLVISLKFIRGYLADHGAPYLPFLLLFNS